MTSKFDYKKFQQQFQQFSKKWKILKKRPETVVSLVAVVLLVVGVFSAVLLSSVEQDIRQQAQSNLYNVSSEGTSCSPDQVGQHGCHKASNTKLVCDGSHWRSFNQNCNSSEDAPIKNATSRICDKDTCTIWAIN